MISKNIEITVHIANLKSILDLDLYGEPMPEERITGPKNDLNLSAGSTYTQLYKVNAIRISVIHEVV